MKKLLLGVPIVFAVLGAIWGLMSILLSVPIQKIFGYYLSTLLLAPLFIPGYICTFFGGSMNPCLPLTVLGAIPTGAFIGLIIGLGLMTVGVVGVKK